MKIEFTRLAIPRQRRVLHSLTEVREDKPFMKTLHSEGRDALDNTVTVGQGLETGVEIPPLVLDTTTDSVIGAFEAILEATVRAANDRVVNHPSPVVIEKKAAAMKLLRMAFPNGSDAFLNLSMPLQYKDMGDLVLLLTEDKEAIAAVKTLGLEWVVAQIVAHLEPYGRAVRAADGRDLDAESLAFHAAFTTLAVKVMANHADDAEIHKRVFGAYDTELEAQQQDERDSRKRAAAKKKGE